MVIRIQTILGGSAAVGGGVSTFYFSDGSTNPQACADAVQDFWDEIAANLTDNLTYEIDPVASEFDTATGALTAVSALTTEGQKEGLSTSENLPPANQMLLRLATAAIVGNRILRGRLFIPGNLEVMNQDDGTVSPVLRTDVELSAQALIDDVSAEWVIWHRPVAGSGGTQGLVTAATTWAQWAVLRSRRD